MGRDKQLDFSPQRENIYNAKLPRSSEQDKDSNLYFQEIKLNLSQAVLNNDISLGAVKWIVNLHKYIILYGLKFSKEDHVYLIKILFGLLTTKHVDSVSLDKFAKVLYALMKKKYLVTRADLILPWEPLFELYKFWEDSSFMLRGLVKPASGFKGQLKSIIKVSRGYFSVESTEEMMEKWRHLMCPHDRSICTAVKYFSLFLPTTRGIPADRSWRIWLPELNMFWSTWGNSPTWEVDILKLYARLAVHQVGELDWEPYMGDLYTRFMNSFNLPVTYGGSGIRLKHGIAGQPCVGSITQWIVSTLGPGSSGQDHLSRLLVALQSYFHPANINNSSELLHLFISLLTTQFINRVHTERFNKKWVCKVVAEKRLRDQDILNFVLAVKPIAFHVLYNSYEDEARNVFANLSLLQPELIIPDLLDRLTVASESLTEPHRFHVCIQALSAAAGPLIRTYPERALDLLNLLLPGIDVNDIWKCTDIFVLMSDLLEMIPISDLTKTSAKNDISETEENLRLKTANLENFVMAFMDRCFTLIENTRRENIRADAGTTDDYLNDEELAADAAINDTFLRIVGNSSAAMFSRIFLKLQHYLQGKIVEPTVAGGILASMCKSVVQTNPEQGLAFFVPYLCECLVKLVGEREGKKREDHKTDEELQFNLQLLGEVLSVKNVQLYRSRGSDVLPYISQICSVLDVTLNLNQKDEYELAHGVLQSLLTWLCHIRLVELTPRLEESTRGWGSTVHVDAINIDWFVPGVQELEVVKGLLSRYLAPLIQTLERYADGSETIDKDVLQRHLKLVWRIVSGVSELTPPEQVTPWESVLSKGLEWLDPLTICIPGPNGDIPLRQGLSELMSRVQSRICATGNDDTDSLCALIYVYDILVFCFGLDEDEIGDHLEDHKRDKEHREDRLHRGKKHLHSVILERISIQWETQLWLKYLLVLESLSERTLENLFLLCVHQYSEVRIVAQEIFLKIIGRIGRPIHKLILPKLLRCLENKPSVTEDMLKGTLYLLNTEKFMFFYSWESAAKLWPALITAEHSDKQSVDDLLRDIGIKMNRYYQEFSLYTLPLSDTEPSGLLLETVREYPGLQKTSSLTNMSLGHHLHFQELESRILELVTGKNLHWRHHEMAVGMLLTMVTYDHTPTRDSTSLWLKLLLDDQRNIRCMAYQALEGILKLEKVPSRKVPLQDILSAQPGVVEAGKAGYPGIRPDNEFMQYRSMELDELEQYWSKPFIVKSHLGYWSWPPGERVRIPHTDEDFNHHPDSVRNLITQFFLDENLVTRFVELNSLEHEKGLDFFSMDRGLFLSFLLENIGPKLAQVFQPHIERLVGSPEESQQRAAAEMVYGLVRGMRFWNFRSAQQAWSWLLPVFQQVLNSVTLETQSDWDLCFSGASNKADPNRLRVMLELLVTSENLVSQGAFKESSYLLFVNKCLSQNWRIRELYNRTYNILRSHWDHPYTNVRHQIANTLATLLSMDIPILGVQDTFNVGTGFPTKKMFLDEVIPMLNLNYHNPEFSREETPVSGVGSTPSSTTETPNTSSEDVSMTMEVDEDTKKGNRILETVSLWILNQIKISSATITEEMFRILPFLCQFIGTETDQDVSQSCLQALCYMSTSILPSSAIEPLLEMTKKISHSSSYKTKLSMLEYIQVAVFTNFPKVVQNPGYRSEVQNQIIHLLQDENLTVRQKAGKILGGLLHSGFIDQTEITGLLKDLRTRIRPKMLRAGRRFKKVPTKETDDNSKDKIVLHHSGILGLCSFVEAFPYDVPSFVPPILMELSTHLNDAQPTPATIKKCLQEFKRTHQDNWQEHKTKFSEDQLVVMTDLLVSQNYYA